MLYREEMAAQVKIEIEKLDQAIAMTDPQERIQALLSAKKSTHGLLERHDNKNIRQRKTALYASGAVILGVIGANAAELISPIMTYFGIISPIVLGGFATMTSYADDPYIAPAHKKIQEKCNQEISLMLAKDKSLSEKMPKMKKHFSAHAVRNPIVDAEYLVLKKDVDLGFSRQRTGYYSRP